MLRLGWMSTARGQGSLALLRFVCGHIASGSLDARISAVISNRVPGEFEQTDVFFDYARSQGLPLICESSASLRRDAPGPDWRTHFDRALALKMEQYEIDVVFMAGYMLIVSEFLCERYPLLNLHPALPGGPTGTWREVMLKLASSGASRTGAMIHIVTPELDRGPALSYFSFPIAGEPFDSLHAAGDVDLLADAIRVQELRREFPLILTTLRAVAAGDIIIRDHEAFAADGSRFRQGRDLSPEVESFLATQPAQP